MIAEAPEIVRDLLRPEAYGARGSPAVSLKTTHSSWVFLVGADVWKVKRPVSLGFLDFTTVEARQHDCEEEVRLNRRLAPHVYLGVEPVRRTSGGLALVGAGPVVDWAVHMRRLPDEASGQALLAGGALDARLLQRLAERLAAFLEQARATPELGTLEMLRANVLENFGQVRPFLGEDALVDARTFEDACAFQTGQLDRNGRRFQERVAEGRIREGHGDLRLEHVYFLPADGDGRPQPVVIDCIEFNQRFRCGDAAGEAGFLAMELEAAGRFDLASGFIARFAEASGDFGLFGVLDFYLSYRAWVRGKVAAFLASDPTMPAEIRTQKRMEARRDFALARSFAGTPFDRPFVIAVAGLIGVGKSTLAEALGGVLAAPVIGSDRTRKALAGVAPTARGAAWLYTDEHTERTYAELMRRAAMVIGSGRGAILDATFGSRRWREAVEALARGGQARCLFVEARCPDPGIVRERLARRRQGPSVSDGTEALLHAQAQGYEAFAPLDNVLPVDTRGPPEAALQNALELLAGAGVFPPDRARAAGLPR